MVLAGESPLELQTFSSSSTQTLLLSDVIPGWAPLWGSSLDQSWLWFYVKHFSEIAPPQSWGAGLQPGSIIELGPRAFWVLFVWLWPRHSEVSRTPEHLPVLFWLFNYYTWTISFLKLFWCSHPVVLDLLQVWIEQNARAICHEDAFGSPCPKIKKPWCRQMKEKNVLKQFL